MIRLVDLFGLFHVDPRNEEDVVEFINLLGEHLYEVHKRAIGAQIPWQAK